MKSRAPGHPRGLIVRSRGVPRRSSGRRLRGGVPTRGAPDHEETTTMHTRSSAAATALLLTASAAGLALTSGSTAQAAGSHANHRAAPKLVVTIKSKPSGPVLSDTKFRPGNTIFRVKKAGAGGLMQVFRLKPGYTIIDAGTDFGLAFPSDESTPPDVNAVRRLDKNVVFYGGARVKQRWAVNIDKAGTYFVLNIEA